MTRKITIKDDLHPEDNAMLQALYSRSPKTVEEHLPKVEAAGSGKFMDQFYVGYGHASIGDCGSTTIFIESVSMLAAKAIQDHPLYSGQEASTRYMNFSEVELDNPFNDKEGEDIQNDWMRFYHEAFPILIYHLENQYPRLADEDEGAYARAIKARAFDVLRAFIPAGAHTNLSWHTNLRQARDKLRWLVAHPNIHIAELAMDIATELHNRYPHSGFAQNEGFMGDVEWAYRKKVMEKFAYIDEERELPTGGRLGVDVRTNLSWRELTSQDVKEVFQTRPKNVGIPPMFASLGTISSKFLLDFGSFRDLQRHRNGYVRMPLLTTRYGFHPWYFEQMPLDLAEQARTLVGHQAVRIRALTEKHGGNKILAQSYMGMGFRVPCQVIQTLPAWVYRVELRTQKSVHPTLRQVAQQEARLFDDEALELVPLHADLSPDTWTLRRGMQTITER